MDSTPMLSVIIVSYNTRDMTLQCLDTLSCALEGISSEVIVVDNGSNDGSVESIRKSNAGTQVIENSGNIGFGAANNQGLEAAKGRFFLLLNSDAFPEPKAVHEMLSFLQRYPEAGVAGPRILNKNGSLQVSCYKFPSPSHAWKENLWLSRGYSDWPHDEVRAVEFVIGACMLVRREAYLDVGGFDEGFFMYSEEADWERRMRDRGWKVMFVPSARVTHLGGASGACEKTSVTRHFFTSLDYYTRKHHGIIGLLAIRAAMIVGCSMRAILWSIASLLPARREVAAAKVRLHSWLVFRQAFHWR
jgi:GT2 family glycosyltransferase